MPTIWLNPTPFGSAQSSTARLSAADCDTSAILPGRGVRWARVAFSPISGTATPNEPGPSARTPEARAASRNASVRQITVAACVPFRASAAKVGSTGMVSSHSTARSGATGSESMSG